MTRSSGVGYGRFGSLTRQRPPIPFSTIKRGTDDGKGSDLAGGIDFG